MPYIAICYAYATVLLLISGGFAWLTNRQGVVNRLFLLLCVLLSVSAGAYSLMYIAHSTASCLRWYQLTWVGWCGYPSVYVIIMLIITGYTRPLRQGWGYAVLFAPALLLFLRSQHLPFDIDGFTPTALGTFTPHFAYSPWATAYYCFERLWLLLGLLVVWQWGRRTPSRRLKLLVRLLIVSTLTPALISLFTYLCGPHGELDALNALGLCVAALGICYAIVRYQFSVPLTTLAAGYVLTQVKDMVLFTTEHGEIVQANRATEETLGVAEQYLIGGHITRLLAAEHADGPPWADPSLLPWSQAVEFVAASGESIPVQLTVSRLSDRFGDSIGLVVIAEDLRQTRQLEREIAERTAAEFALQRLNDELEERIIQRTYDLARLNQDYYAELQERRRTEQALRESEARYRTLFENANDGIFIVDLAFRPLAINDRSCERLGYTREEICRISLAEIMPPEMLTKLPAIVQHITSTGHAVFETIHLRKDGTPVHLEMNSCLVEYAGSTAILTIARDLADRKRYEERERMLQQLQETSRMHEEFLSYISHELKTPLTPIIGGVDLLINEEIGPLQQPQRAVLEMIDRQSHRLLRLIEDLLDLCCVEQGHLSLQQQRVQVPELLQDCVEAYAGRFRAHGLSLHFIAIEEALPPITGDAQRLGQIFDNLLSNAFKYTQQGGVTVQCDQQEHMLRVRISDTGLGLTAEQCARIFEPFYQADTHQPGAGLGLTIVKQLVEAHGGAITMASDGPNQGACATLLFPALPAEAATALPGADEG